MLTFRDHAMSSKKARFSIGSKNVGQDYCLLLQVAKLWLKELPGPILFDLHILRLVTNGP